MIAVCLLLIFLSGILSDETDNDKDATILVYEHKIEHPNYSFKYETSNGIIREEEGKIKRSEAGEEILVVTGYYSFTGPDNMLYSLNYIADDKGYRTVTDFLGNRIGSHAITSLQGGGLGRSTYTTENGYEKNEEDLFTSKPVYTQPNINSLNNRDKINKFTQNNKNNKVVEANNNTPQIDMAINNNDTDLSKKAGELGFPDRIGTPAIISLQGPPGK